MKPKVIVIGSNPSVQSPDLSAFHPSTRSRKVLDTWFDGIDAEIHFMNILDEKRPGNKGIKTAELKILSDRMILKLQEFRDAKIVTVGKTADECLTLLRLPHFSAPHPSGLNRQLNDPEYVYSMKKELADFVRQS